MGKIIDFAELAKVRERHPDKRIVLCHGVFDLLHFGHIAHLRSAKDQGDVLVVTVTSDSYVNKGPGRPYNNEKKRAAMLAALADINYVAISDEPRAVKAIQTVRPHFYVKGPDYSDTSKDATGGIMEEEAAILSVGGELVFTSDETESSTEIINRFFRTWDEDQRATLDQVQSTANAESIMELIESLSKLRVLVVGEPIIDTYVFCEPMALSSKGATVSARYDRTENYAGGSLAIARHLRALGCEVTLLMTYGGERYVQSILDELKADKIELKAHVVDAVPTPRKTRYIAGFMNQKLFELVDLHEDQWQRHESDAFCKDLVRAATKADIVLVADFGHGLFESQVTDCVAGLKSFIGLNVQTNSGNLGFNVFTKYSKYNYLSIDERELRLGVRDRFSPVIKLSKSVMGHQINLPASVTLGTNGSIYFDSDGVAYRCPTFFKEVIDTTGAGDAYFLITSLLAKRGVSGNLVPFIGNCYAGLKTRIIGNKSAVSKVDLMRTVGGLLK